MAPPPGPPRVTELEYLCEDQPDPFENGRSFCGWRRPRQMMVIRARSAPASMPGKKPTATAAPGKRGHIVALPAGAGLSESMPAGEVVTASGVEVDEADDGELVAAELVALSRIHWLLSQE